MPFLRSYKPQQFKDSLERIWVAEMEGSEYNMLIPPTQYVDLLIPLNKEGFMLNDNLYTTPMVEGVLQKPVHLKLPPRSKLLGIRFYGFGWYPFGGVEGREIADAIIPFVPDMECRQLIDKICSSEDEREAVKHCMSLLNVLYNPERELKIELIKRFYKGFISDMSKNSIEEFCQLTDTNYMTLNRAFTKIVGIPPKKFERLLRFRKSFDAVLRTQDNLTEIGYNAGYFDQPHFVKEFKYFMGMSPSEYLRLFKNERPLIVYATVDFSVF